MPVWANLLFFLLLLFKYRNVSRKGFIGAIGNVIVSGRELKEFNASHNVRSGFILPVCFAKFSLSCQAFNKLLHSISLNSSSGNFWDDTNA